MIIQNNIGAMNANRQLQLNTLRLQGSLQKLSSGYRINSAADDAAGLSISERMRAQMTGIERAALNAQDGASLIQTAEGGLGEVHSMLNRLADLAGQAANGTLSQSQRNSLQREASDILGEIDRISQATNFNGANLLDGSLAGRQQVSARGPAVSETAPTAGQYAYGNVAGISGLAQGDTFSVNLSLNNRDSYNVSFTVNSDLSLTAADGTVMATENSAKAGGRLDLSGQDFAGAVAAALQGTGANSHFTIEAGGAGLTFENRAAGTRAPQITGFSYQAGENSAYQPVSAASDITSSAPADAQRYIAQDRFTLYDGTNESTASFNINGQDYVLVNNASYADTVSRLASSDTIAIGVDGASGAALTGGDLQRMAADINRASGTALSADTANGRLMLRGQEGEGLTLQIGDTAADYNQIAVRVNDMSSRGLGIDGINLSTAEGASAALSRIGEAVDAVSSQRGSLGAVQNRLAYTIDNLAVTSENLTAAESRVRDTDMAKMMMDFVKGNVLSQASQAMLAQANLQSQQVLQLLR